MQIIGMDILLEGRGRAKSALILFKRLRFREMGGTSNGPKIRNKISATFRHLNLLWGGGDSHMKVTGMLVGKLELNP